MYYYKIRIEEFLTDLILSNSNYRRKEYLEDNRNKLTKSIIIESKEKIDFTNNFFKDDRLSFKILYLSLANHSGVYPLFKILGNEVWLYITDDNEKNLKNEIKDDIEIRASTHFDSPIFDEKYLKNKFLNYHIRPVIAKHDMKYEMKSFIVNFQFFDARKYISVATEKEGKRFMIEKTFI